MKSAEDWVREYWNTGPGQFQTTVEMVIKVREELLRELGEKRGFYANAMHETIHQESGKLLKSQKLRKK